jgi:hypothetical protein
VKEEEKAWFRILSQAFCFLLDLCVPYTVKDPNVETTLQKTLSTAQWNAVKKLIRTGTGYFRIKAWDGINRYTISETRSFSIQ